MADVHASAIVAKDAELDTDVRVGPFCVVGSGVRLGSGTELISHVTIFGPASFGSHNRVFPFTTLGAEPQDKSYAGEATRLEVGNGNVFREQVTVHRGTVKGDGLTRIGDRCWFMVGAHVAHDCRVGNDVILTNLATLGGHVIVEDNVVCGGHVAVAPFVRLGRGSFLAGGARVERDVPPFVIAAGDRARVRALNRVGLRRLDVPQGSQKALEAAYRKLWMENGARARALPEVRERWGGDPYVAELIRSLENISLVPGG